MKHLVKYKWFIGVLLVLVIVGLGLFVKKDWVKRSYYRVQTERTVRKELKPLQDSLTSLGFNNLSSLQTSCNVSDPSNIPENFEGVIDAELRPGRYLDCSSSVSQFIRVPEDKKAFQQHAEELSKVLQSNGWESREDYPTIQWFKAISEGVDYQPDQYNHKDVNGWNCVTDFFTAFSKPEPAALNMQLICNKSVKLSN